MAHMFALSCTGGPRDPEDDDYEDSLVNSTAASEASSTQARPRRKRETPQQKSKRHAVASFSNCNYPPLKKKEKAITLFWMTLRVPRAEPITACKSGGNPAGTDGPRNFPCRVRAAQVHAERCGFR